MCEASLCSCVILDTAAVSKCQFIYEALEGARDGEMTVAEVKWLLEEFGKTIGQVDKETFRRFYAELINTIEILPDADWKRGEGIVSKIRFKLPMIYGDKRTLEVDRQEDGNFKAPDKQVGNKYFRVKENTDETIALLTKIAISI